MKWTLPATIALFLFLVACETRAQSPPPTRGAGPLEIAGLSETYRWIDRGEALPRLTTLERRFTPPDGYARRDLDDGSYAAFLRGLPVRLDRTKVRSYRGRKLGSPSAAIVYLDVGDRDLQQCADSAIRLHAEWLWSKGAHDDLAYHFTSGDRSRWLDYARGERFSVSGSEVERRSTSASSRSRATFGDWLELIFRYAGTRSLAYDSRSVPLGEVRGGDFFVAPGSPGHAVVVLDVAENEAGEKVALLGQGFMPAQEFHVIRGRGTGVIEGVWWKLRPSQPVDTPSWRAFDSDTLRRFE